MSDPFRPLTGKQLEEGPKEISEADIIDLMDDLNDLIERYKKQYGPLELACGLGTGLLRIWQQATPVTKQIMLENLSALLTDMAIVMSGGTPSARMHVQKDGN